MSTLEKDQFNRLVLESIPVAMVTMNNDFQITSFNKPAEKLTGYSASDAVGRPCYEILNSSRCENGCPLRTIRNVSELPSGLEADIVNFHGEHISIRITPASILNEEKNFVGYLDLIEDISMQKKMEREKTNFISMVAHDMKSPLVGISGLINRLKKKKIFETNERLREYLKVIGEAENRLESMVRQFLEYSRMERGQIRLEIGETDINTVLQQVIEMHQLSVEGKDFTLSFDSLPLTKIEADANRLHRVFSNIIDNAIKYSLKPSEINIKTKETNREIVIYFRDQGCGINPDEIPYIFDAFYRAGAEYEVGGHGLGLAACDAIIRQHGGRILVESMPGKGSLFTVRLPKT